MDQIKLGNDSFRIYTLFKALQEYGDSYKTICEAWEDFGYSLGLTKDEVDGLREKLGSGACELHRIPRDILRIWKHVHGNEANMDVLYEALIDINLEQLAGSVRERFGGGTNMVLPPPSKKMRPMSSAPVSVELQSSTGPRITAEAIGDGSNKKDLSLISAVQNGLIAAVERMLKDGTDLKTKEHDSDNNVIHSVIQSYSYEILSIEEALRILDLIVSKDPSLVNEKNRWLRTPIFYLAEPDDFVEELLYWFYKNGADFNAVDDRGYTILFHAIRNDVDPTIIRKILEFGANPNHVDIRKRNALHLSALQANTSALEIFIHLLDVNEGDENNCTPLHLLFTVVTAPDLNPECLEFLLKNGATFSAVCSKGYSPLVKWIKECHANPFPSLVKMKDHLNISKENASDILSAIVQLDPTRVWITFLYPSENEFRYKAFKEMFRFLIEEKKAKLKLNDTKQWSLAKWESVDSVLLKSSFLRELLKSHPYDQLVGKITALKASKLGKIDFHSKSKSVSFCIEKILLCLLASKHFHSFQRMCEFLSELCGSPDLRND